MHVKPLHLDSSRLTWPSIIIVSALAVGIAVFAQASPLMRSLVAFWFLLVCPGMAYIPLLKLKDALAEWLLAIALSLALETALALGMVYAHWWQPGWGLILLIGLSLVGVALQVREGMQSR